MTELDTLRAEREPLQRELNQIKNILRKNKMLVDYISEMKLIVKSSKGEEIPVTKETLLGFMDNTELLVARRKILAGRLNEVNRKISSLEQQRNKEEQLVKVQTAIETFDSNIKKIKIDPDSLELVVRKNAID